MIETTSRDRVELCAARSLGLSENLNDAKVLMEAFRNTGVLNIELPEHSILKDITGEQFLLMLEKALIQFNDDGAWIDVTREEVEKCGGAIDDLRGSVTIYYRVANPDGSIPLPPTITEQGDRMVVWH